MKLPWEVHKFGGASLANGTCFKQAAEILQEQSKPYCVVVSAVGGVTDLLYKALDCALEQKSTEEIVDQIRQKHIEIAAEILSPESLKTFGQQLDQDLKDIQDVFKAVKVAPPTGDSTGEIISSYGELWCTRLISLFLEIPALNAREVIIVEKNDLGPSVQWAETEKRFKTWIEKNGQSFVATGYVASLSSGSPTTLGRNGTDFSASIFAHLLDARKLHIWKDVDGIMSADPKKVLQAYVLPEVSYQEATEMAFFGAKILHPRALTPAMRKKIPIYIKNVFKSEAPGTCIKENPAPTNKVVKGFSTMDDIALINIQGTGMLGIQGTSERVFGALKNANISVVLISQASSEQSICFAVRAPVGAQAQRVLKDAFRFEIESGNIESIELTDNCSILAAVGDDMVETPGVSAQFFTSLARAGVNIRAIAQGSSERNISVVIDQNQTAKALRAAHSGFYLSNQTLSIGIVGVGLIGKTLIQQIRNQAEYLRKEYKINLRVRGLMNSKQMLLSENIDLTHWPLDFEKNNQPANVEAFEEYIKSTDFPHSVIIDCTASESISKQYGRWLKKQIHVITPNKKANSEDIEYYRKLRAFDKSVSSQYYYETTVGAGLPVIATLKDLIQTGDKVLKIEGILSGTLSYLFNTYDGSIPFSEAVKKAKEQGFTEPDPREDLSGTDVARKLVILARETGLNLGLSDLSVENLVPEALQSGSIDDFLSQFSQKDGDFKAKYDEAKKQQKVLRYIGQVNPEGESSVSLQSIPNTHPFANLVGSDNIIAFTTERYLNNPLIVRGPGAGPEVTAAGVFADLLRLARTLGS